MKAKHSKTLRRALDERRMVRVVRALADGEHMQGFVLGLSDELILLYAFSDFHPDGCYVLRTQDVVQVRSGKCERVNERILELEGLLDWVRISTMPPLDDLRALLGHLCEARLPCIVEREPLLGEDEDKERFLIGFVTRVGKRRCRVHHFNALGEWDDEPTRIKIENITCVQLEALYTETWLRHIARCPSLEGADHPTSTPA